MELGSYHHSGAQILQVAIRFFENLWNPLVKKCLQLILSFPQILGLPLEYFPSYIYQQQMTHVYITFK